MRGTVAGVSARVPGIGTIDAASTPTEAQVETWLDEGASMIDGSLAQAGYNTDVASSAALYSKLAGMEELYAAATLLESQGIDTVGGGTEGRSGDMFKRFYAELKWLTAADLTALGGVLVVVVTPRRGLRTRQTRRVDGYSGTYEGSATQYSYPSE